MIDAEWMMYRAVLSRRDPVHKGYMESALRMRFMSNTEIGSSHGYVEQRTTNTPEEDTHFYVKCLEGGDHEPIRVNTLEDGMNLL